MCALFAITPFQRLGPTTTVTYMSPKIMTHARASSELLPAQSCATLLATYKSTSPAVSPHTSLERAPTQAPIPPNITVVDLPSILPLRRRAVRNYISTPIRVQSWHGIGNFEWAVVNNPAFRLRVGSRINLLGLDGQPRGIEGKLTGIKYLEKYWVVFSFASSAGESTLTVPECVCSLPWATWWQHRTGFDELRDFIKPPPYLSPTFPLPCRTKKELLSQDFHGLWKCQFA